MLAPRLLLICLMLLCSAVAVAAPPVARADTFVVDSAGDEPDDELGDDFCAIDDEPTAPCTLRAAIQNANHAPGPHTIAFDLPPDELRITPETPLPAISESVTIDGRTQDGWEERPLVVLDGSELPPVEIPPPNPNGGQEIPGPYLLQLAGVDSHVDALVLTEHETALLAFTGAHGSSVARSFVGTTASGNQAAETRALAGVWVQSAAGVLVGGAVGNRNIIAGSDTNVMVTGRNSVDDMVFGNSIGFGYGEDLVGHADFGVLVSEDLALGMPSGTQVIGNVVGGGAIGIRISEAPDVSVLGNWVGFDESGHASDLDRFPLAPDDTGIDVVDAPGTIVGGTGAGAYNAIAGLHHGIAVRVRGRASGTRVEGNRIGTDIAGMTITDTNFGDTRNEWGIVVQPRGDDAPRNVTIGGAEPEQGNLVSNNGGERNGEGGGIAVDGPATDVRVLNNLVGGKLDGTGGLPNRNAGVAVIGGEDRAPTGVRVGAPGDGNVVSDVEDGWGILNHEAPSTLIQANRVGVDREGGPGGVAGGIAVLADGAVVGGRNDGEGNLVAAVQHDGIVVGGASDGAKVIGNWVGTDPEGHMPSDPEAEHPYSIGRYGIAVRANDGDNPTATRIGGTLPGEGNLVGRAGESGIAVVDEASLTRVEGNLVGLQVEGDDRGVTHGDGILVEADDTIVGGELGAESANHVAGTGGAGVRVSGAERVLVQGNVLGRAVGAETGLELGGPGIRVERGAKDVWVGYGPDEEEIPVGECSGPCNHIGFVQGGAAVSIAGDATERVTVRGNEPYNNDGRDIDLDSSGILDEGDLDTGANGWLNAPTAVRATVDPRDGKDVVSGVVESDRPESLRVDVYAHEYAAGETVDDGRYVGTAVPDERGTFRLALPEEAVSYTAVALDSEGNVSDQSKGCRDVSGTGETDRDGDGLCDQWEEEGGLDFDGDGVVDERLRNADPEVRDLYLELDYMDTAFWEFRDLSPSLDVLHRVHSMFANAPGGGIALHFGDSESQEAARWEPGEEVPHADRLRVGSHGPEGPDEPDDLDDLRYGTDGDGCTGWFGSEEQREDEDCWAQLGARGVLYRYGVMADRIDGKLAATQSGQAFAVGLGDRTDAQIENLSGGLGFCITADYCRALVEAGAIAHELGHTLGLGHHGDDLGDDEVVSPTYLSVMNPIFALPGLNPLRELDYSRTAAPPVSEAALDEPTGLPGRSTFWTETLVFAYDEELDHCVARRIPLGRQVDFDRDGDASEQGIAVSLNEHDLDSDDGLEECQKPGAASDTFEGFDDYAHLRFDPATVPTFPGGAVELGGLNLLGHVAAADGDEDVVRDAVDVCTIVADPGQEDADGDGIGDACLERIEERDLSVDVDVAESAEGIATATVTLRNAFPLAATGARVTVTLPGDWEPLGAEASAGTYDAGSWVVPEVGKRGAVTLTLTGRSQAEGARVVAELAAADQPDWDSTAGGGDPREDDRAERPLALPRVDVADASATEGTRRARTLAFPVRLSRAAPVAVRVRATTADGSATAAADYVETARTVTFAAGETEAVVEVPLRADREPEPDETLTLTLSGVDGASAGDVEAVGTIEDDDEPAQTGDLLPLTCIGAKVDDGPCGIEDPTLRQIRDVEVVGDRDVYVTDGTRIALYQRDATTERLRRVTCWSVGSSGTAVGCARFPKPADPDEHLTLAGIQHMTASADGRTVAMALDHQASGENDGFAVFRREDDGMLRLTGCVGHQIPGSACLDESVTRGRELLLAPDGRFAYIVTGAHVRRIDLDAEGAPTAVSEWTVPGAPEEAEPSRAALSPDGVTLVTRAGGVLYALTRDAGSGALAPRGSAPLDGDGALAFSRDGATVFAASDGEDATVRALRAADLQPVACASRTAQAGCAPVPALRGPGGLAPSADGSGLYVALSGGGVLALRRAADGSLAAGRCVDPETGAATCGSDDGEEPQRAVVQLTTDGRAAFAADGAYAHQLLRRDGDPGQNRAPVCADAVSFGQPGEVQTLRLECVDPDGDAFTLEPGTVAHGTLDALDPGRGTVAYTPAAGFRGPDELVFRARDARGAVSADARVSIAVANDAPVCRDNGALIVTNRRGPVVAPCSDADGDPLAVEVVQAPAHGTLGAFDGIVAQYDPAPGYRGADEVKLRVSDGHDVSGVATVAIAIDDRAPGCLPAGDTSVQVGRTAKVKIECADPEGTPVKLAVAGATSGRASLDGNELTFRAGSRGGVATVTVRVTDGDGRSTDLPLRFHVSEPGSACRRNCQPDGDGEVTVEYRCNGSRTDAGGYASCEGSAVIVVCGKSGCRTARGTVAAAAAGKKVLPGVKGKRLGSARAKVKPGRTGQLKIKLSRPGRKLLARKRKLRVKIVVQVRQLDGTKTRTTQVVTLKAPKQKRGRR